MKKNSEANGWSMEDHPPQIDEVKPEYSKYWFVKRKGKETTWTQTQSKKIEGEVGLKNLEQVQSGCRFMECLGFPKEKGSQAITENMKYTLLMKEIDQCKSTYKLNYHELMEY